MDKHYKTEEVANDRKYEQRGRPGAGSDGRTTTTVTNITN